MDNSDPALDPVADTRCKVRVRVLKFHDDPEPVEFVFQYRDPGVALNEYYQRKWARGNVKRVCGLLKIHPDFAELYDIEHFGDTFHMGLEHEGTLMQFFVCLQVDVSLSSQQIDLLHKLIDSHINHVLNEAQGPYVPEEIKKDFYELSKYREIKMRLVF